MPNDKNLSQVNHKDRNKNNNSVSNLEWVSGSENMTHCCQTGKSKRQIIKKVDEEISEAFGWKQYKNTNYWFHKDGRCANKKTNKYRNSVLRADGYLSYSLYIDKTRMTKLAHRLIYEVFSGEEIQENEQINHKDGNKANNSFSNLEKVSRSENMVHCYYELGKKVKRVVMCDLMMNKIADYPSMSEAARQNNCDVSGISQACSGKIKTYKGYVWKYKEV